MAGAARFAAGAAAADKIAAAEAAARADPKLYGLLGTHAKELAELKAQHAAAITSVKNEHAAEVAVLNEALNAARAEARELTVIKNQLADALAQLKALQTQHESLKGHLSALLMQY